MLTLSCKDMGLTCAYVAKGNTEEEVIGDFKTHAIGVHKKVEQEMTAELIEMMKRLIKKAEG